MDKGICENCHKWCHDLVDKICCLCANGTDYCVCCSERSHTIKVVCGACDLELEIEVVNNVLGLKIQAKLLEYHVRASPACGLAILAQ